MKLKRFARFPKLLLISTCLIAALALLGAACGDDSDNNSTPTPSARATTSPSGAASTPTATRTPTPSASGSPAAAAGASVKATQSAQYGMILTDASGRTLYLFTRDEANKSNCVDACATTWPPLTTTGPATASTGATASLLGTTTRADGSTQVTYNGHPLYYYAQDTAPSDTKGQNVGTIWFVVSPSGDSITS